MLSTATRLWFRSTWNIALVEVRSNWRLTLGAAVALSSWVVLTVLSEPAFLRSQKIQVGWDGLQWTSLLAVTLTMSLLQPEVAERQTVAWRRGRRPLSALLGIGAAWVSIVLSINLAAFVALRSVDGLRHLPLPSDWPRRILATFGPSILWALLLPGLAAWTSSRRIALLLWSAIWLGGLALNLPWPLAALTSQAGPRTLLLTLLSVHAFSLASVSLGFRADRHPR